MVIKCNKDIAHSPANNYLVFVDYEPEIENRECEYVLSLSDILSRRRNKILSHNNDNLKYISSDNQWCISYTI